MWPNNFVLLPSLLLLLVTIYCPNKAQCLNNKLYVFGTIATPRRKSQHWQSSSVVLLLRDQMFPFCGRKINLICCNILNRIGIRQNNTNNCSCRGCKTTTQWLCCRIWSIKTNMAKFIDKTLFQRTIENVSHPIALPMTVLYYLFYVHLFVYTFQEHFVEQTQQWKQNNHTS